MVDETDMVSLKLHWAEAIFLCDTLGLPYPEAHLMKQKWQQMTLMGGYAIVLPSAKKAAGEGE